MSTYKRVSRISLGLLASAVIVLVAGCATYHRMMGGVALSGANEAPPVSTHASGTAYITVKEDHSVSGHIKVSGMHAVAAHIHEGAPGKNGPVIIPLKHTGMDSFVVPAGAKFTEAQYEAYEAGDMYVNVHSPEHKAGEIRGQLHP